jgi:hypothetical protein
VHRRPWRCLLVSVAVLAACTSGGEQVSSTCTDDLGDVRGPAAWADVRSATVTADDDAIEAVVEFAHPLPADVDGEVRFVVGILEPPDADRSVLGQATGTAFLVAEADHGTWRFGALDGRRDDVPLAAIGTGEASGREVRLRVPTSRVGRTGAGSGWTLTVQPRSDDADAGDTCPNGLVRVDF